MENSNSPGTGPNPAFQVHTKARAKKLRDHRPVVNGLVMTPAERRIATFDAMEVLFKKSETGTITTPEIAEALGWEDPELRQLIRRTLHRWKKEEFIAQADYGRFERGARWRFLPYDGRALEILHYAVSEARLNSGFFWFSEGIINLEIERPTSRETRKRYRTRTGAIYDQEGYLPSRERERQTDYVRYQKVLADSKAYFDRNSASFYPRLYPLRKDLREVLPLGGEFHLIEAMITLREQQYAKTAPEGYGSINPLTLTFTDPLVAADRNRITTNLLYLADQHGYDFAKLAAAAREPLRIALVSDRNQAAQRVIRKRTQLDRREKEGRTYDRAPNPRSKTFREITLPALVINNEILTWVVESALINDVGVFFNMFTQQVWEAWGTALDLDPVGLSRGTIEPILGQIPGRRAEGV